MSTIAGPAPEVLRRSGLGSQVMLLMVARDHTLRRSALEGPHDEPQGFG